MIAYFAKHPTAANLLMLALLAAGLFSLPKLRRETFPDFQPREVEIRVPYPGATSGDVEEGVCQRIEDAIDGVRFVEEVRCEARDNFGVVTVEMAEGGDWSGFKDEIDTQIAAIDDFPLQTEEPVISELHTTEQVFSLLVSGDMSPSDLKLYAEDLKDRLQELPGVELILIQGFSEHQLRIELSAEALVRHNLSPADVADAISRQSLDIPAGTIKADAEEILVRFTEERNSAEQLADLVVLSSEDGAELRLRELGTVVDDFRLEEDQIVLGGRRAALLRIQKTETQDALTVAAVVKEFLHTERSERPAVELVITEDISRLIEDRLGMLVNNGWQGMLLVFAVMWLFFNIRLSVWVVASLPVSFLGAFILVPQLGLTINMMSMVGLLLAIGILMDDGIVIAENIAAHRERGKPALQAAIDGVAEVSGGVLSSFVTTVCVLGPLAFLSGNIGRVLEVVPAILLLVLGVSLIEAFMILPSHLGHSLQHARKPNRFRRAIDQGLEWTRSQILGRTVDFLIRWRYAWLGVVVSVFLVSVSLPIGGILKFKALPDLDGDTVVARILLPQGTPLTRTKAVVDRLTTALERVNTQFCPAQPEGQSLVKTVYVKYNENADAFETGPHVATIYADLLDAEQRATRLDDLLQAWRHETGMVEDAISVSYTEPVLGPTGRNIEIRARGGDLKELREVSLQLQAWLNRFPGVSNLTTDLRPGKREYHIRFRPGVLGLELDSARMARQLRAAFQGELAAEIQVGSESYEIEARFDRYSQRNVSDLERFRFTLPDGQQVPLSSVATITEGRGWSRIARVNRMRTATISGDVDGRVANTEAVLGKLRAEYIPQLKLEHPEVGLTFEGETAEAGKTRGSLARGMIFGAIGIFFLLSFQFRSFVEPIIVMMAIPFALIGVIWGHLIMGYDLTMPSILGFISLAGIVVNDSILLVLFLKSARARGDAAVDSAGQASRDRFRAILITSATTIVGLLPLTFETSLQAQVLIPLTVSIVFGLLASTVLVLLVIPCTYVILNDFGLTYEIEPETDPDSFDPLE